METAFISRMMVAILAAAEVDRERRKRYRQALAAAEAAGMLCLPAVRGDSAAEEEEARAHIPAPVVQRTAVRAVLAPEAWRDTRVAAAALVSEGLFLSLRVVPWVAIRELIR